MGRDTAGVLWNSIISVSQVPLKVCRLPLRFISTMTLLCTIPPTSPVISGTGLRR